MIVYYKKRKAINVFIKNNSNKPSEEPNVVNINSHVKIMEALLVKQTSQLLIKQTISIESTPFFKQYVTEVILNKIIIVYVLCSVIIYCVYYVR